jgi:hypothetical protein
VLDDVYALSSQNIQTGDILVIDAKKYYALVCPGAPGYWGSFIGGALAVRIE